MVAFGWPLLASPGSQVVAHAKDAPWLFALLLPLLLAVVLARGRRRRPRRQGASRCSGCWRRSAAALRPLGGGTAGFEPMFFLLVLGGRVLGPRLRLRRWAPSTLFASALLTGGVGPWLPFQMLAAAWVGFGAGLPAAPAAGRAELALLAAYGFARRPRVRLRC